MSIPDSADSGSGEQPANQSARKWRLRPRLLLYIAIPTVAAVALGGMSVVRSSQNAVADQRSEALASLSVKVNQLAFEVESERDSIVMYIAAGSNGRAGTLNKHASPVVKASSKDSLQVVEQQVGFTDPWLKRVRAALGEIGPSYSQGVQGSAKAMALRLHNLLSFRNEALNTAVSANDVLADYGIVVNTLLAFNDEIARNSTDSQFASTVRSLATIAQYENEDSVQRAIVMYGLTGGTLLSGMLGQLTTSIADQRDDLSDFDRFATTSQVTAFNTALALSLEDRVTDDEGAFVQHANQIAKAAIVPTDWYGAMTDALNATHGYEETLAGAAVDRARALHQQAIVAAIVVGGIILLVLVLSLLLAGFIGRSTIEPPRRLDSARRWWQPAWR